MPLQPTRRTLLVVALAVLVFTLPPSVNALPGFSDHTGPTDLRVTDFERVDAGCADAITSFRGSSMTGGTVTRTGFVEARPGAPLSAWTERTSPAGGDLSTFRVHVDAHDSATNATVPDCRYGVVYRLTVTGSGGSPEGVLPDAHGYRILWTENGAHAGCTDSLTSPLDAECSRLAADPTRTWANATAARARAIRKVDSARASNRGLFSAAGGADTGRRSHAEVVYAPASVQSANSAMSRASSRSGVGIPSSSQPRNS